LSMALSRLNREKGDLRQIGAALNRVQFENRSFSIRSTRPLSRREQARGKYSSRRASNRGCVFMPLSEYLQLLDCTGRQIQAGVCGSIPEKSPPILDRLNLSGVTLAARCRAIRQLDPDGKVWNHLTHDLSPPELSRHQAKSNEELTNFASRKLQGMAIGDGEPHNRRQCNAVADHSCSHRLGVGWRAVGNVLSGLRRKRAPRSQSSSTYWRVEPDCLRLVGPMHVKCRSAIRRSGSGSL